MAFTEIDKLKAMAIVHIFETSRPFGDYAAYAVLNDGAGVSYGINQFTHRSGSLALVIYKYLKSGGQVGQEVFEENLAVLRSPSTNAIRIAAADKRLEKALKAAAATREMRAAQHAVAFERYLLPASEACEGSQFVLTLSLAVIYDSINHGSWERIRDRVSISPPTNSSNIGFEKAWITVYVRKRHEWLLSIPRLRPAAYRTSFFLAQIAQRNWNLDLPFFVHGVALTKNNFRIAEKETAHSAAPISQNRASSVSPDILPEPSPDDRPQTWAIPAKPADGLDKVQEKVDAAAATYDQAETIVRTVLTRSDAAKSLWATVVGTVWQSLWALLSFLIGLPKEVWLVVALIVAALVLFYLYRQFALGKIREISGLRHTNLADLNKSRSQGENI